MSNQKYYLPLIHRSKISFYPYLRLGGFGLGNILFPFFRALCSSLKNGANLLYPHYNQIQPRNFFRELNIKSLRNYSFDFNKMKWICLPREKSAFIYYFNRFYNETHINIKGNIVFFGLKNYFYDFIDDRETVRKFIYFSSRRDFNLKLNTVAIHIRLGDFLINNQSIEPIKIISSIEYFIKKSYKVEIYSDADKSKIIKYLKFSEILEKVIFIKSKSPLNDIIQMSEAEYICGSPYSTFVEWARFIRPDNLDINSYSLINRKTYEEINISPLKWSNFL